MTVDSSRPKGRLLLIDDEEVMQDVLSSLLIKEGYALDIASDGAQGVEMFTENPYDLVLLDLMLPKKDGFSVLREIRELRPEAVVIMLTAFGSIETAVRATREGAWDFVTKPFKNDEILLVVRNGLQQHYLTVENMALRKGIQSVTFESMLGRSRQMQEVFRLIQQVAPSKSTVIIVGESGTGKELAARAVHNCSPRAERPFIPINCGNIPTELLESELFGFKKGAFTGANATKRGLFEVAADGTIFLDEVGNISAELQAKLLRVIQEREFRRLGDVESIRVDVRILAASNEDLKELVRQGRFREDLYYRLNVIKLQLAPLRERREDIPLLVQHFIQKFCRENDRSEIQMDKDALEYLMNYRWPGNVRELENVIERAVVLCPEGGRITTSLFPPDMVGSAETSMVEIELTDEGFSLKDTVADYERRLILQALKRTGGNQKRAAALLQLNATTLNEKIKRLNIHEDVAL